MKAPLKLTDGRTLTQIDKTNHFVCHKDRTLWELSDMEMIEERLYRWVYRFYPETGKTDRAEKHPVPEEWEGEPEDICIKKTAWEDMQAYPERIAEIRSIIKNGDNVFLIDDEGNRVALLTFTTNREKLETRPIQR